MKQLERFVVSTKAAQCFRFPVCTLLSPDRSALPQDVLRFLVTPGTKHTVEPVIT